MKNEKNITLNIQMISKNLTFLPQKYQFLKWIQFSLQAIRQSNIEVLIRIVEKKEIKFLNFKFRNKNYTTNILSFSYINDKIIKSNYIGDLVICGKIIEQEANEQKKELESHWAHITIHGILHLLGYDHTNLKKQSRMETLEIKIMKSLNYKNPYTTSNIKLI